MSNLVSVKNCASLTSIHSLFNLLRKKYVEGVPQLHNFYYDVGEFELVSINHSQRFVSSIGNIEKAVWVFNCLGRSG